METLTKTKWRLFVYDALIYVALAILCFSFPTGNLGLDFVEILIQASIAFVLIFLFRFIFRIYRRIWRFEGVIGYLSLIISDFLALLFNLIIESFLPITPNRAFFYVGLFMINTLICLFIRLCYRYIYKYGVVGTKIGAIFSVLLKIFAGDRVHLHNDNSNKSINIAIVGAGRTGVALMEDLSSNPASYYSPKFFIDIDHDKIGKHIEGIKVYEESNAISDLIKDNDIKEVVVAIPDINDKERAKLFDFYKKLGIKVKVYDFPITANANAKRQMRNIDIEDLMPRKQVVLKSEELNNFYKNKVVMITGGGGSIGSEIARQVANMGPKQLILLDIYENGVYDLQQELVLNYGKELNLCVEITSVTDYSSMDSIFEQYKPEIVIHAAAHKHVPLMEHNPIEAVKNNIFGTKNVIDLSEKHNVYKFMLVSTDKAVNPTNVMGATKRFCEMLVQCANARGKVRYGATRFGNVLGSAGSVVPLFRRQIENGGPVTITDKRIIRYFMTIPEACSLVLQASVMANNGELFVLDMGSPVRILDLAKNMIDISGVQNIDIVETGLRPGEKLFEELLIDYKVHKKTENELIFVEKENQAPIEADMMLYLDNLNQAIEQKDTGMLIDVLRRSIPEYKDPEEINYNFVGLKSD